MLQLFDAAAAGAAARTADPGAQLVTPEGRFRVADFTARLGGQLTDLTIALTVGFVVWIVYFADYRLGFNRTLEWVALALLFALLWALNAAGWSPGKRAAGIRVLTAAGRPPGVWRGLLRTVAALLSAVPLGLGYLWAAWDGSRRTWHDRLAGTHVVRVDRDPHGLPRARLKAAREDFWLGPRP